MDRANGVQLVSHLYHHTLETTLAMKSLLYSPLTLDQLLANHPKVPMGVHHRSCPTPARCADTTGRCTAK